MIDSNSFVHHFSVILSAMLTSSCCLLQLAANVFSFGCLGFAVLTPYRHVFMTILALQLGYKWFKWLMSGSKSNRIHSLFALTVLSLFVAFSDVFIVGTSILPSLSTTNVVNQSFMVKIDFTVGSEAHSRALAWISAGAANLGHDVTSTNILRSSIVQQNKDNDGSVSMLVQLRQDATASRLSETQIEQCAVAALFTGDEAATVIVLISKISIDLADDKFKHDNLLILRLNGVKCAGCFSAARTILTSLGVEILEDHFDGDNAQSLFVLRTADCIVGSALEEQFRRLFSELVFQRGKQYKIDKMIPLCAQ